MSGDRVVSSTTRETIETLFEIERTLDLFEREICGVRFWERVRFSVHRRVLETAGYSGQPHASLDRSLWNRARFAGQAARNIVVRNPYLAPRAEILFFGAPRRKLREDGKWWDIYCDPIIEGMGRECLSLEGPYLGAHFTPARTRHLRYLELPLYQAAIRRKLGIARARMSNDDISQIQVIENEINRRLRVPVSLVEMVRYSLLERASYLPILKRILERVRPGAVVIVCSYGNETLVEACRGMGIPTVELQHGMIGRYHAGYSFPDRATKGAFPDYFFAFGDYWRQAADLPIEDRQVVSVGFPFLEAERSKFAGVERKPQVLFVSQGTVGTGLSRLAVALSKWRDFPFEIVFKLHPGEWHGWRQEYPWLTSARVQVIEGDSPPLYWLFASSMSQVGVNSTALLEGMSFGLATLAVDLPGAEDMEELRNAGLLKIVPANKNVLAEELQRPMADQAGTTTQLFRPGGLANVRTALERILSGT